MIFFFRSAVCAHFVVFYDIVYCLFSVFVFLNFPLDLHLLFVSNDCSLRVRVWTKHFSHQFYTLSALVSSFSTSTSSCSLSRQFYSQITGALGIYLFTWKNWVVINEQTRSTHIREIYVLWMTCDQSEKCHSQLTIKNCIIFFLPFDCIFNFWPMTFEHETKMLFVIHTQCGLWTKKFIEFELKTAQ